MWTCNYGLADFREGINPSSETLFRVDSNTKPITATAILQLRDLGLLDVNDPVIKHVPEFERVDIRHGKAEDVTLRRLLTHRAGLNGEAAGAWSETGIGPTTEEMLRGLGECAVVIPPDSQHKYCNLGFILLGEVVSRLSGIPYTDYIQTNIFDPLEMGASTYDPDSSSGPKVTQYFLPELEEAPTPAPKLVHNAKRPAGGIYSSVNDMARWLSFQFRTDAAQRSGPQVLPGPTLQEMHHPQYTEADWESGQCLSWHALHGGARTYLGHGGGNAGSASQTHFNKRRRIGMVILTNTSGHGAHLAVAKSIMDKVCGVVDEAQSSAPCRSSNLRLLS